jgi:hypothetical protein
MTVERLLSSHTGPTKRRLRQYSSGMVMRAAAVQLWGVHCVRCFVISWLLLLLELSRFLPLWVAATLGFSGSIVGVSKHGGAAVPLVSEPSFPSHY